ncbi:MAG TPA: hybrid sensor histidine kinase/response regulator [Kofleriaceae bacterium]|nr:hybrid sensor histidine kinase/response regulator [Kofleriaceae bacterium]
MALVYVLDDDPLAARSAAILLGQESDLEVASFTRLGDLRAAAEIRAPDAVLVEVTLGDAGGIDMVEGMTRDDPDLVTIAVTSARDPDATAAALSRVGPLRHVHKPFEARELLPRLRAGLERRELARGLAAAEATLEQRDRALHASRAQVERTTARLEVTSSELATATERLVEAEQLAAVGRVLTGVAHEITSQLALVGYAEAIRTRVGFDPELMELCDVIVNAHKRLCAMVDQIRDFVAEPRRRGDSGELAREPADVMAVVDEALAILRYDRDVRARNLVKRYRARPLAALHREKFSQVVINLVSNAVLATRSGDAIEVELDVDPGTGELMLTVTDHGVGMSPAVLARLGQPFFTTRGDRGSGLGVGICMRIAEEHGGSLTYESREGSGTQARVRLPQLEGGRGASPEEAA